MLLADAQPLVFLDLGKTIIADITHAGLYEYSKHRKSRVRTIENAEKDPSLVGEVGQGWESSRGDPPAHRLDI